MAKRKRITAELSRTIAESAPLIKTVQKNIVVEDKEELIDIELSKLSQNPYQPRMVNDSAHLEELILSIEQNGLLQPIVITENGTNNFTILAGHRRVEAFKTLGKKTIKGVIRKNISNRDMAILAVVENAIRVDLNPLEFAISLQHLLNENIVESQNKLAEFTGLSKGYISKLMSALKLPPNVIENIKKDNYSFINVLAILNRVEPDLIMKAYQDIKKLSSRDAEELLFKKYITKKKNVTNNNFKSRYTKNRIRFEVNIAKMNKDKVEKIKKAIEKIIKDFE